MKSTAVQMPLTRPQFGQEELRNLSECLASGWVTQGPFVRRFEQLFAARHEVRHAIATTSCTSALHLAAMALDLKPGDEVVVPAFTWVTSAHAAEYVGARAVLADIDLDTYNLSPAAFEEAIRPRTRAVVVVHLFGLAAPMDELLAIARKRSLAVIEDAACAVGTTYDGRPIGALGDLGCFSFHPRKVITTGEGGMVTSDRDDLAERVASFRNHGATQAPGPDAGPPKPYMMGEFNHLGFNLRLSDIQGAVGVAQMARLDELLAERQSLAAEYRRLLASVDELKLPVVPPRCGHTYQSFVVRVLAGGLTRRNRVMERLAEHGIPTRPGTHAVHRLGYYRQKYGLESGQFPAAAAAEETTITLPMFPGMTDDDVRAVVDCVKSALAGG